MRILFVVFAAFAGGAGAVVAVVAAMRYLPGHLMQRRVEQRLFDATAEPVPEGEPELRNAMGEGALPKLEQALGTTRGGASLSRLIEQSGTHISVTGVLMAALACAVLCGAIAAVTVHFIAAPLVAALIGVMVPFAVLRHRRTKRIRRFEEQFPDALDLLSRAIRAGHAFTTALGMAASEGPDPIGPELRKTYDQQNFGLPLKEALTNLAERVPLMDVRFFVTAVLIQRETGGNLAEILDNLSYVVRERFKVLRQVRVHTAHGRFTGYVLIALPAALAIVLMFINPEHMGLLFTERMGQIMLTGAVVMQVIGYLWIRRVVKIEV